MSVNPKEISLAEVKEHNKPEDLWVVIENKVYDLSKFRKEHPGGEETLDAVAGTDATTDFIEVGHSDEARTIMKKYFIGNLAAKDQNCECKVALRTIGIAVGAAALGVALIFLIRKGIARK